MPLNPARLALSIAVTTALASVAVAQTLPNGVAAGDVTGDAATLWTHTTAPGAVTIEYAADPAFAAVLGTTVLNATNPLVPVKDRVDGLSAGTRYYYRATDAAGATAAGTFKTAAASGVRAGFTFGVSGDWRGELSPYPAVRNVAAKQLDLFVGLGDTVYADYASPDVPKPQAETLEDYRRKNNEVYSARAGLNTLADVRGSTAWLAQIDDHEVINDFAGGAPAASDPRIGGPGLVNESTLYANGIGAFHEYNPIEDASYGATGDPRTANKTKLYRAIEYGADAAVISLDARSFRDAELPGVTNPLDPAQVGAFLGASFDPTRTMLGRQQVADLKADLLGADDAGVTWKFVMVPEPIQNLGVVVGADRFEGYAAERTEILKFIDDNDIANVVFVAADIHGTLVNNLTYQTSPGGPQTALDSFEITTGSVAFDAPFGPTVADIATAAGLLTPEQKAFYDSLPTVAKDQFIKGLVDQTIAPLGYDPVGLEAGGPIDATLLQGDYVATHTFGWTEFDIDPLTQQLLVTTWGIDPYTAADATDPAVVGREPRIVSQFSVNPQGVAAIPLPPALVMGGLTLAGWVRANPAGVVRRTDSTVAMRRSVCVSGNEKFMARGRSTGRGSAMLRRGA